MTYALRPQMFIAIPISRDRSSASNRITIDETGRPRIHYMLVPEGRISGVGRKLMITVGEDSREGCLLPFGMLRSGN
jgi:hypothetical protein